MLFDFDNVLRHHLPVKGYWIENPSLLTGVPRNINVLSATVSFPRFLGNFMAGILYALGRENEFRTFIGGPGVKTPAGDGRMVPENILKPAGELPDWAGRIQPKTNLYVKMDFGAFDPNVHAALIREASSWFGFSTMAGSTKWARENSLNSPWGFSVRAKTQ